MLSYKKDHPSVYLCISETAKIIRNLRKFLAYDQLATEGALREANSLGEISIKIHNEESAVEFLVGVDVPKLLTDVLRSLYEEYPNVFSSEEQVGQTNLAEIFY